VFFRTHASKLRHQSAYQGFGNDVTLNVAKHDLGKVRLEPMQSAVSPFTVRDLRGSPLEICRAVVSHCIAPAVLPADHCGSFALYFGESLRILALTIACSVAV